MSRFLEGASALVVRGWPVLPLHAPSEAGSCSCENPRCGSVGKHPRPRRGAHDASSNLEVVMRWAAAWPEANIGIASGPASGLLVLDIDPRNGGDASLETLEAELGMLPHTVQTNTGGGGFHLLFRAAFDLRVRGKMGAGVDVKFTGGYVVAPPSIHASGRAYSWATGRSPSEVHLAELPARWIGALRRDVTRGSEPRWRRPDAESEKRARAYARQLPPAISGAHGHDTTFRAALAIARGFALDEDSAFRILREEWNPGCIPPWSEGDLRRKVREAVRRGGVPWGYLLDQSTRRLP